MKHGPLKKDLFQPDMEDRIQLDRFITECIINTLLFSCGYRFIDTEKMCRRHVRRSSPRQSSCVHQTTFGLLKVHLLDSQPLLETLNMTNLSNTSCESDFGPSSVSLRACGADRRAQAALLQLCDHQHVFEVRGLVVKRLHQAVRLLPLCAVEQLHLIGQTLSLVDSLGKGGTRFF